jgi:hypothetical protein
MTSAFLPLFAAEGATRETFGWGRIQSNVDWLIPIGVCVVLLVFVRYMYQRDARELSPPVGWLLTALRTAAFLGLLVLYLDPTWRTEREVTRPSRALVMVDTSLSMGITDVASPGGTGTVSRSQQVAADLEKTDLLKELRKTHDVVVFRFDQDLKRVVPLDRIKSPTAAGDDAAPDGEGESAGDAEGNPAGEAPETGPGKAAARKTQWNDALRPSGSETRLGQSLRQLVYDERSSPLSGVIIVSDGGQNAGVTPEAAIDLSREAKVPVFAIGIGSDKKPANVRVSDLIAPARAYPGDRFTITAYVQAQEMAKRTVSVELLSRKGGSGPATAGQAGTGQVESSQQVILGTDGEVVPVKFEQAPSEIGRRVYCVRVLAPKSDRDPGDNFREADVEVVDRKNRVLLLAGGPTREYQFLRNLLYRDKSSTVDVVLQTAKPGISQDANKILDDFPATREELYQYDCVVAFDPDWQALSSSQTDLLESWVAEQGGGLILVAGPVYMGRVIGGWTQDKSGPMDKIRALYPVEFVRRLMASDDSGYTAEEPWALDFTRAGIEADYLWLGDTASASQQIWAGFKGVYSYFPVQGAKPGAAVLARFSDPRSGQGEDRAPYLLTQFYGSGRVFYMGSGEMWRLRAVDDTHFEHFYTKLIRHVSQGRLLRGSSRGVLLVGQEQYLLGNTVEIRAQLTNAQLHPLEAPGVTVQVIHQESGSGQTVNLVPDPTRIGTFTGQFNVLKEGSYRLELPVPESDDERLVQTIRVRIPKLESETPQRNDALLSKIAKSTEGEYYLGIEQAVLGAGDKKPLPSLLKDRTRTSVLTEAPNPEWKEHWLRWIMFGLCGVLFLEWLIRRLVKLA